MQVVQVDPRRRRISLAPEGSRVEGTKSDYAAYVKQQSRQDEAKFTPVTFNYYDQLNGYEHLTDLLGPKQGEQLSARIVDGGYKWNARFDGRAVVVPDDGPPLPEAAAREMFQSFFGRDNPGDGRWQVAGAAVDPSRDPDGLSPRAREGRRHPWLLPEPGS